MKKFNKILSTLALVFVVIGFCTGTFYEYSYAPTCTVLTGSSPTIPVINLESPVKECSDITLGANTTLTTFATSITPMSGWVEIIKVAQPSGGHNYTFALSGSGATPLVYTTGCLSLPTMPTGTGHSMFVYLLYNPLPASPELDVLSCPNS